MDKKDRIISLFRIGMDRKAIADHEDTSRSYINEVIKQYKKERGSLTYYYDRFKFNETYRTFVYSTIIAILMAGFSIYQTISTSNEIFDLKVQNENYSLKIIEITSAIEQSLRLDDINEIKRILNETIKEKEIYISIITNFANDFYKRANLAYELGDYRQSVYFFELIIDSNSERLKQQDFWFKYGLSLMQTRHLGGGMEAYDKAISSFNKCINLAGSNNIPASCHFNLGKIYLELSTLTGNKSYLLNSKEEFDQIIENRRFINEDEFSLSPFFFGRGLIKQLTGDQEGAISDFKNVKSSQEYYYDSQAHIANSLYQSGKYNESLNFINDLLIRHIEDFSNPANYYNLYLTYSYVLKDVGIKENDGGKIIQSYEIVENITKNANIMKLLTENFDLYTLCHHKGHLVGILTGGNQSLAEYVFNQCYTSSIFLKTNIYKLSPFDAEEQVDFLLDEVNITDSETPLNLTVDMYINDKDNKSIYLGTYVVKED